jgi:putative FmdB family regulatory protein
MPIYEFKCQSCNNVFEFLCFPSDGDGDILCPTCGGKDNEKLLSAFSCISSGSSESLGGCAASPTCAASEGLGGGAAYPSCASSGGFS